MASTRRILKHVTVETAAAARKCHHNNTHAIRRGESCLVIRNDDGLGKKNYCTSCAGNILDKAKSYLTELACDLSLS